MALGRDHICWHQPEDAWETPPAPTAPRGWLGFPFPSERLLSLSSASSTWRDTGKELFQQIFSYRREGGARRALPAALLAEPLAGTGAQQVHSSPRGHQQIFPHHWQENGWVGWEGCSLSAYSFPRALSPSPLSPSGCTHCGGTSLCRSPTVRGGAFAKLISVQGFSLSQARIFLTPKGPAL